MDMKTALIVGVGPGLSSSLARLFARHEETVRQGLRKIQALAGEDSRVRVAVLSIVHSLGEIPHA